MTKLQDCSVKQSGFRRLVIGGGHCLGYPVLRPCDIGLNIQSRTRPDILADLNAIPLPDTSVDAVYFEYVPYTQFIKDDFKGLQEAVRVLRPGGTLLLITGREAPEREIISELRRLGCHSFVRDKYSPLRLTAQRGPVAGAPQALPPCGRQCDPATENYHARELAA